jgi:hypothetical protein
MVTIIANLARESWKEPISKGLLQCTELFLRIISNLYRSYLVKHEDAGCGTSSEGTLDEEESREDVCLYDSEHSNGELLN